MANAFYIRDFIDARAAQRLLNPSIGANGQPKLIGSNADLPGLGGAGVYRFDDNGALSAVQTLDDSDTRYLTSTLLLIPQSPQTGSILRQFQSGNDYVITANFDDTPMGFYAQQITVGDAPTRLSDDSNFNIRLENGLIITAIDYRGVADASTITFANGASIRFNANTDVTFQLGADDAPRLTRNQFFDEVGFEVSRDPNTNTPTNSGTFGGQDADSEGADTARTTIGAPRLGATVTQGTVAENSPTNTDVSGIVLTVNGGTGNPIFTVTEVDSTQTYASTRFGVEGDGKGNWNLFVSRGNALDFEDETDDDPDTDGTQIELQIAVTSNGVTSRSQTVQVTLTNENDEDPVLTINGNDAEVFSKASRSIMGTLTVTDDSDTLDNRPEITLEARANDGQIFSSTKPHFRGEYGTLTLTGKKWEYQLYAVNQDVEALQTGDDPLTETFEIRARDGVDTSVPETLTLTILPNQVPTITYQNDASRGAEIGEGYVPNLNNRIGFLTLSDDTAARNLTIEGVAETFTTKPTTPATSGFATGTVFSGIYADWTVLNNSSGGFSTGSIIWQVSKLTSEYTSLGASDTVYEQLTLRASDAHGAVSVPITVVVQITGTNNPPTTGFRTGADALMASEGIPFRFHQSDFIFNDVDEGDTLHSIIITGLPVTAAGRHGTPVGSLTLDGDDILAFANNIGRQEILAEDIGKLVYHPVATAEKLTLYYKVSDGRAESFQEAGLTFTVQSNTPPTAADKTLTVTQGIPFTFQPSDFGFMDADGGDTLHSVIITELPAQGRLSQFGNALEGDNLPTRIYPTLVDGSITFTPDADNTDPVTLKYRVSDGEDLSAVTTLTFNIRASGDGSGNANAIPPNSPPELAMMLGDDTVFDGDSGGRSIDLSRVFTDADNDLLRLTVKSVTADGATGFARKFSIDGTDLLIDTNGLDAAAYTVTIQADDRNGGTISDTFTVTINPPPPPPMIAPGTTRPTPQAVKTTNTNGANTPPAVSPEAVIMTDFTEDSGVAMVDLGNVFTDADNHRLLLSVEGSDSGFSIAADGTTLVIDTDSLTAGNYSITIRADDRNGGKTDYTFTITITNPAPTLTLMAGDTILDEGEAVILTRANLGGVDSNDAPEALTYTLNGATNAIIEKNTAEAGQPPIWQVITTGTGKFTQADVNAGLIRLMPKGGDGTASIRVSLTDDGGAMAEGVSVLSLRTGAAQSLDFAVRLKAQITSTTIGGGEFHIDKDTVKKGGSIPLGEGGATGASGTSGQAKKDPHILVETGLGDNPITTGTGDDIIDAGLGIDAIDLSHGGADEVIYRFKPTDSGSGGTGGFVAWDGADKITGFEIGSDVLTFASTGDNAQNAGGQIRDFVAGLGTEFKVALSFEHRAGDVRALESYDVSGIDIHFPQALMLASGRITGSKLAIEFAEGMAWADFNTEYLGGEAFNMNTFLLNGNAAGREALGRLLGASVELDTSRGVIIGTSGDDAIDASSGGETVILGQGGADSITLGSGAEEVVYRLSDNGTAVTSSDGTDTITNFALGSDSLRFVDMEGNAPTLTDLLTRFDAVTLTTDENGNYEGITFTIASGASMTVNFATPISQSAIPESITATHLESLFGGDNIDITNTLPTELL